jgi:hypothetical protein
MTGFAGAEEIQVLDPCALQAQIEEADLLDLTGLRAGSPGHGDPLHFSPLGSLDHDHPSGETVHSLA